jgi:hypothetical protein
MVQKKDSLKVAMRVYKKASLLVESKVALWENWKDSTTAEKKVQ